MLHDAIAAVCCVCVCAPLPASSFERRRAARRRITYRHSRNRSRLRCCCCDGCGCGCGGRAAAALARMAALYSGRSPRSFQSPREAACLRAFYLPLLHRTSLDHPPRHRALPSAARSLVKRAAAARRRRPSSLSAQSAHPVGSASWSILCHVAHIGCRPSRGSQAL